MLMCCRFWYPTLGKRINDKTGQKDNSSRALSTIDRDTSIKVLADNERKVTAELKHSFLTKVEH